MLADEAMAPEDLDRAQLEAELQTIDGNMPMLRDQIGRAAGTDREQLSAELRQLERQYAVTNAKLRVLREIGGYASYGRRLRAMHLSPRVRCAPARGPDFAR